MSINIKYKALLGFIITILIVSGSCKGKVKPQIEETNESLNAIELKNFIGNTFKHKGDYWDRAFKDLDNQQKQYSKEIIINPGKFKLRYFFFGDGQHYNPFAVEITNFQDSLINHFSFKDELFYMYNTKHASWNDHENEIEFPKLEFNPAINDSLKTLEMNLNILINKIGYQQDENAIRLLLSVIFSDLLNMTSVSEVEIVDHLNKLKKINHNNQLDTTIAEYNELLSTKKAFRIRAKEGRHGYWILEIVKNNNKFVIKPKFIGDLLYYNFYM